MKNKISIALIFCIILATITLISAEEEILPRHIFYNSPRIISNPAYLETCYPKGEVMFVLPDAKCCEGLDTLSIIDEAKEGCSFISGGIICLDCGNQKCEYGENKCNCAEDCTYNSESTITGTGSECNDHIDNNGDGYCDAPTRSGYCLDGSQLGDEKCRTLDSSEIAPCIPSEEVCDGYDNDYDGLIDEEIFDTRSCGLNKGECEHGTQTRVCYAGKFGPWSACIGATLPTQEICGDEKDNDCDEEIDENCADYDGDEILSPEKPIIGKRMIYIITLFLLIIGAIIAFFIYRNKHSY